MPALPSLSATHAARFLDIATKAGFRVVLKDTVGVVAITKDFAPGDKAAFIDCDATASHVLDELPARGGSRWGTDGGSVGGHYAITHGMYCLNQSGVALRFTKALGKLLGSGQGGAE